MRREPISICVQVHLIFAVYTCLGLIAGCTTTEPTAAIASATTDSLKSGPPEDAMVVRKGRYRLVELVPGDPQGDLMQQIVDITFPAAMIQNVADALRYLLLRSGYRLREDCKAAHAFDELPLPATHVHLGPLTLRDALQVLLGAGWQLEADETARTVCFAPRAPLPPHDGTAPSCVPEHDNE